MKLYDKLSKENKEKVDNYQYPNIKERILKGLDKHYVIDLTLLEASELWDCINGMTTFNLLETYELFE